MQSDLLIAVVQLKIFDGRFLHILVDRIHIMGSDTKLVLFVKFKAAGL